MFKKTITYNDFNGIERTEDFYFHLTKAELIKLEFSESGGLTHIIEEITKEEDTEALLNIFDKIIRMSYGKRSLDGKHFEKKPEYANSFLASEAYSELFMEFMQDANKASEFINGIVSSIPKTASAKENVIAIQQ
nr:MAG TPA: hypothetical protein [Caudoviricetes sp.]